MLKGYLLEKSDPLMVPTFLNGIYDSKGQEMKNQYYSRRSVTSQSPITAEYFTAKVFIKSVCKRSAIDERLITDF